MIAAIHLTLGQVAATLALVAVAALVSVWQRADLERDIAVATVRSFVQLTAIGYVIKLIFDQNRIVFVIVLIAAMVLFGAVTAQRRARHVPHAFWPLLIALALAGTTTLALVVALGVFKAQARYLVPVGGMVIGNAMTAAAVALNRLGDDIAAGAAQIEATLAPGATPRQTARPVLRRSLRPGMIPLIDSTKTNGLIFFPRPMGGMLLPRPEAGPSPPPSPKSRQTTRECPAGPPSCPPPRGANAAAPAIPLGREQDPQPGGAGEVLLLDDWGAAAGELLPRQPRIGGQTR